MRFSVDSNVLVYAFFSEDDWKHSIASDVMIHAMLLDCVLTIQSIGEFLNVVRRKRADLFEEARAQAERWTETIQVADTSTRDVIRAAEFAAKHKLQLWDSVIWQVARSAHAVLFLSEDLQDQLTLEGMKVLNPFAVHNQRELKDLLSSEHDELGW